MIPQPYLRPRAASLAGDRLRCNRFRRSVAVCQPNVGAAESAQGYLSLGERVNVRGAVLVVRQDEVGHCDVNHRFAVERAGGPGYHGHHGLIDPALRANPSARRGVYSNTAALTAATFNRGNRT